MAGKNSKEGNAPSGFGVMPSKTVSTRSDKVSGIKSLPMQGTQSAFKTAQNNTKKA